MFFCTLNFKRSGKLNYTKALEMTSYLQAEEDYVPWQAAIKSFNFIKSLLTPTRPAYKYLQVGLTSESSISCIHCLIVISKKNHKWNTN